MSAVIPVIGPLSQRSDFFSWLFGGASYEEIREYFNIALESSSDEIIFEIDSSGGVVAGLFPLIEEIVAARDKKKIIAVINERAYSAAYGIASAAHERYIPITGGAGSIGAITIHADQSELDKKEGIKYTAIFSGKRKNDFTPHKSLSVEEYNIIKAKIDALNDILISTVADNIGVDEKNIRSMEAGMFQGQKAIDVGLADNIGTLSNIIGGNRSMSKKSVDMLNSAIKEASAEEISTAVEALGYVPKESMISIVEHEEKIAAKTTEYDKILQESKIEAKAEATKETKAEILEILDLCAVGNMPQLGLKMITDGISKEDARKQIMEAQASNQNINSTINPLNSGETNPLLADAKKRAGLEVK